MVGLLWLIPFLPFAAFLIITAFLRRPSRVAGYVSIAAIAGSFLISLLTLIEGLTSATAHSTTEKAHAVGAAAGAAAAQAAAQGWRIEASWEWLGLGPARIEMATMVDGIGAIMLVVVTFVSLLVQIYSLGYMVEHGEMDPGFSRFYGFLSLFTTSMLGLVLANNFVQLFVFWELVGLCSYLLVGFWYFKPEAAEAAKKAFITTRFGDLGFLIGILFVFYFTDTFNFGEVREAVEAGAMSTPILAITMILLFCGAIGKSAQFPLHVWLPDAMEGPTPVSALIHAATMVAAGVFMVARLFALFEAAPAAMNVVAWIGGITALFAATQGLVMRDIKRVLAYSTISQLGYMMMALGMGGLAAGTFHLTTHAFFKALLFLGSGSVIHGSGVQDMFHLGGLRRKMPATHVTFAIGSLALAGVFPLAGFWSKDEILGTAFDTGRPVLLLIGVVTAFLTAFYIARAYFLTFFGAPRPGWVDPDPIHSADAPRFAIDIATAEPIAATAYDPNAYYRMTHLPAEAGHGTSPGPHDPHAALAHPQAPDDHGTEGASHAGHGHHERGAHVAHESPGVMTGPLWVLSFFAIVAGFVGAPFVGNPFGAFVTGEQHAGMMNYPLAIGTTLLALLAIWLAYRWYGQPTFVRDPLTELGGVYTLLARRYYLDELYNALIAVAILATSTALAWFDRRVIDGIVNLVGWTTVQVGYLASRAVTGRAPNYALAAFGGLAIIVLLVLNSPVGR